MPDRQDIHKPWHLQIFGCVSDYTMGNMMDGSSHKASGSMKGDVTDDFNDTGHAFLDFTRV